MCAVDDISDSSPCINKVLSEDITVLLYLMKGFFFFVNESISCTGRKEKRIRRKAYSLKNLFLVETKRKTLGLCWSSRFMFGLLYMPVSLFL